MKREKNMIKNIKKVKKIAIFLLIVSFLSVGFVLSIELLVWIKEILEIIKYINRKRMIKKRYRKILYKEWNH